MHKIVFISHFYPMYLEICHNKLLFFIQYAQDYVNILIECGLNFVGGVGF